MAEEDLKKVARTLRDASKTFARDAQSTAGNLQNREKALNRALTDAEKALAKMEPGQSTHGEHIEEIRRALDQARLAADFSESVSVMNSIHAAMSEVPDQFEAITRTPAPSPTVKEEPAAKPA